ncbi:unnamed protein product [Amoebophrya sp. A25]|nr:unnamed protein product [Amoebophrya sp. A25]|eukprot:GSA25T00006969001.1
MKLTLLEPKSAKEDEKYIAPEEDLKTFICTGLRFLYIFYCSRLDSRRRIYIFCKVTDC